MEIVSTLAFALAFVVFADGSLIRLLKHGRNPVNISFSITDTQILPLSSFGLGAGASFRLKMEYRHTVVDDGHPPRSLILVTRNITRGIIPSDYCLEESIHRSLYAQHRLSMSWREFAVPLDENSMEIFFEVRSPELAGFYNSYFIMCGGLRDEFEGVELVLTQTNAINNYLPFGDIPLVALYASMSILFTIAALVWIYVVRKQPTKTLWIHRLMTAVAILKSISTLLHAMKYHTEAQGSLDDTWSILYYISAIMRGGMHVAAMALIGSGWLFIKASLSGWECRLLVAVVASHTASLIAQVVQDEALYGSKTWRDSQMFLVFDFIGMILVMLPIMRTQRQLETGAEMPGKVIMNQKKYRLWSAFYVWTVAYLMIARLLVGVWGEVARFDITWMGHLFEELMTLAFYISTGFYFRPVENNPYFHLNEDELAQENELMDMN